MAKSFKFLNQAYIQKMKKKNKKMLIKKLILMIPLNFTTTNDITGSIQNPRNNGPK